MVSRHWTGLVKPGRAGDYIAHLLRETFPTLSSIAGFKKASILQRELAEGTEFLVVTEWESLDAIKAFAGAEATRAVVPPVAQAMMLRFDESVKHYQVAHTS